MQAVAVASADLEGLHHQDEHGHDHGEDQEYDQEQHQRDLRLAEVHLVAAAALAADGGVALADADDALVGEDDQRGQADQDDAHGVADALGRAIDEVLHLGGQGEVADAVAKVGGNAVSTDGLAEGHDDGAQHAGQDQGDRDVLQDLGLAGAADLAHLLQLGVDGA